MSARSQEQQHPPPNDRVLTHLFFTADEAAHDRSSLPSGILALLTHLLLLLLAIGPVGRHLLKTETDPGVGTGIGAGAAGGGGGGREEEIAIVTLESPPAPATPATQAEPVPVVPPPPPPVPVLPQLDPPRIPPVHLAQAVTSVIAPAVSAGTPSSGQGTGLGPGRGPGTGPGSGGGSGGGEGGGIGSDRGPGTGRGRLLAPVPDFVLLPPTPTPGSARGKTIVVRLAIDIAGTVKEVELIPSTGDRGFDQALRKTALGWHFRPARDAANAAVPVTYDVSFSF